MLTDLSKAPFPWFGGKQQQLERLWLSPHCLQAPAQLALWEK